MLAISVRAAAALRRLADSMVSATVDHALARDRGARENEKGSPPICGD
jgi:hypothetical protein